VPPDRATGQPPANVAKCPPSMARTHYREIPYNYTSASDEQIVEHLFGPDTWSVLEELRAERVTGRSARLLLRFIGDLFMLGRNPFLYQQLVDSPRRRRGFLQAAERDLDVIARTSTRDPRVVAVVRLCLGHLEQVGRELSQAERRRARVRRVLGSIVGEENVSFDPFALVSHSTDATDWRLCLPLAVVRPAEEAEVAPLLAAIGRLGLHAIPRGAGTGLTGGAVPLRPDCVIVNLERLDRIREIREERWALPGNGEARAHVMELEAGVITEDAMTAAAEKRLVFATDPTSAWASTIGGNLAENAGGKSAVLWGTAIDNVLSWRMAMPTGVRWTICRVGHPLRKIQPEDRVVFEVRDAEGELVRRIELGGGEIRKPNLWKDITNKSLEGLPGLQKEGTDGVITSACFVLYPEHAFRTTACLEFFGDDFEEASRVILRLSREFTPGPHEALLALEHFDEQYVRAIDYQVKAPRNERPQAVLLIDLVAHKPEELDRGLGRLRALLADYPDTVVFFARDGAEAARFWQDRKRLGAIARHTNAFKLNEDVVLPLDRLAEFARFIQELNLDEDRHNQAELLGELGDSLGQTTTGEWLAAKLPHARAICRATEEIVGGAGLRQLREGEHLDKLKRDLVDLFAGYGTIVDTVRGIFAEVRSRLIVIATHMHAGDGNVHVNIPVFSNDRIMMQRAARAADLAMRKATELGGVVSGEHGIGITKLRHLEPSRIEELTAYRREVDPEGMMNPGKLSDLGVLDHVFTPSFNLLELEARILQHDSLEALADKISKCVRCGKCKPSCCVFYPAQSLFYHPRNKNLAIGALIEALLYEAQRFRTTEFRFLRQLEEVADHCTICHKCRGPCPVDIDTGEVSILERQILTARKYKRTTLATRASLAYLGSRSRAYNALFRRLVLRWGTFWQRIGAALVAWLPGRSRLVRFWPLSLLGTPMPRPAARPLHRLLPKCQPTQALLFQPSGEAKRTAFYFPGCGSERLYSKVGQASLYVLLKVGCRVVMPPPFLCCGFPIGVNAKAVEHGRKILSDTIIFSQIREMFGYLEFDACVVSCGTCREALGSMGVTEIFGCGLRDVSEFALGAGLDVAQGGRFLYHKPCHDSLADGGRSLLQSRLGAEIESVEHCCSEAGTLALSRPDISAKMLDRKARVLGAALSSARRPILTNCPSCLQGLGRQSALGVEPRHVAVELARRLGGAEWESDLTRLVRGAEAVNF
jgi:FAD/FMN-containing dehydrogenase/Fe-S oxidoreductase